MKSFECFISLSDGAKFLLSNLINFLLFTTYLYPKLPQVLPKERRAQFLKDLRSYSVNNSEDILSWVAKRKLALVLEELGELTGHPTKMAYHCQQMTGCKHEWLTIRNSPCNLPYLLKLLGLTPTKELIRAAKDGLRYVAFERTSGDLVNGLYIVRSRIFPKRQFTPIMLRETLIECCENPLSELALDILRPWYMEFLRRYDDWFSVLGFDLEAIAISEAAKAKQPFPKSRFGKTIPSEEATASSAAAKVNQSFPESRFSKTIPPEEATASSAADKANQSFPESRFSETIPPEKAIVNSAAAKATQPFSESRLSKKTTAPEEAKKGQYQHIFPASSFVLPPSNRKRACAAAPFRSSSRQRTSKTTPQKANYVNNAVEFALNRVDSSINAPLNYVQSPINFAFNHIDDSIETSVNYVDNSNISIDNTPLTGTAFDARLPHYDNAALTGTVIDSRLLHYDNAPLTGTASDAPLLYANGIDGSTPISVTEPQMNAGLFSLQPQISMPFPSPSQSYWNDYEGIHSASENIPESETVPQICPDSWRLDWAARNGNQSFSGFPRALNFIS